MSRTLDIEASTRQTLAFMNRILAIFAIALLAGCASTGHQFAAPGTDWKSATGQLRYKGGGFTVIGDLLVSKGADGARLDFSKGPGLSLMRVQSDKTHIRFEGRMARGTRVYARGTKLPSYLGAWGLLEEDAGKVRSRTISYGDDTLSYQLPPLR